ncbi:efflux transporter periplasmic adaptor subunit, partial [Neisseria sp. P0021.S006]
MSKVFKWAAGTAVIVAAAFGGWSLMKPEPQSSFITEVVKRGDIRQTVS